MIQKLFTVITSSIIIFISFNIYSKDIYKAPSLKLDHKKGQTVVIQKQNWESNYHIEDNSDREVASMKDNKNKNKKFKRDPSSKKKVKIEYWEFNRKYK